MIAMKFVAILKENYNYQETEEGPSTASKGWFHCFISWRKLIMLYYLVAQIKMPLCN